jgi:hypothetical protein
LGERSREKGEKRGGGEKGVEKGEKGKKGVKGRKGRKGRKGKYRIMDIGYFSSSKCKVKS